MQSFKQAGTIVSLTAPYARNSGEGAKVGAIFGVACSDVENGADGEFMVEGVHYLAKASGAISQGDRLYWDDSAKNLTKTATAGMFVGAATADADSGDTKVYVRLNESAPELNEGNQGTVADVATADADGTYGAAEATLINETKAQLNALLAVLRIQGLIS